MSLLKRFGYYFGGFSIGLVLLAFFLNGKKASCDYGPDARVIKNINLKKVRFSNEANAFIASNSIDTLKVNYVLHKGDINFSESDSRKKPCAIYQIEGEIDDKDIALTVENCEKTATLKSIKFLD